MEIIKTFMAGLVTIAAVVGFVYGTFYAICTYPTYFIGAIFLCIIYIVGALVRNKHK